VAGTRPVHEASFRVRAAAFSGSDWYEFRKAFKVGRSGRPMRDPGVPPWARIDGRGFTLWVSEVRLADSRTVPPTWEIRLQSLAPLNAAGEQCWAEVCEGIERFIRASGLERVEGVPSALHFGDADAEPSAATDPARMFAFCDPSLSGAGWAAERGRSATGGADGVPHPVD
jgi:hypothetical protein